VLDYAWLYDLVDPDEQVRGRALERRRSAVAERQDDPILAFLRPYPEPDMAFASFALLFLRWEASYPDDWRSPDSHAYSPWSIKQGVLGRFGQSGVPDALRSEAADLVLTAVQRPYRCKDWSYALLVDHVQTPAFQERLQALADGADTLLSVRARFLQHVAARPGRPLNRNSWRRWLDETGLAVRTNVR
jgi:hypothetical protein